MSKGTQPIPSTNINKFYKAPLTTVAAVPAHNLLIIGGDFSAQLGSSKARFNFYKVSRLLTDFMKQSNLIAANTRFQNPPNRLWTHGSPSGYLLQLDYILVRRKRQTALKMAVPTHHLLAWAQIIR